MYDMSQVTYIDNHMYETQSSHQGAGVVLSKGKVIRDSQTMYIYIENEKIVPD